MKNIISPGEALEITKNGQPGLTCRDGSGYSEKTVSAMIDAGYTVFITRSGKPRQKVTKKLLKEVRS